MLYIEPNQPGSKVNFKSRYQNFIGGGWVDPVKRQYFENSSPINGKMFCEIPAPQPRILNWRWMRLMLFERPGEKPRGHRALESAVKNSLPD